MSPALYVCILQQDNNTQNIKPEGQQGPEALTAARNKTCLEKILVWRLPQFPWRKCWRRPAYHRYTGAGWGHDERQRRPTQLCREGTNKDSKIAVLPQKSRTQLHIAAYWIFTIQKLVCKQMFICYDLTTISWFYVWHSTYFFVYYSCILFFIAFYCSFVILCAIDTRLMNAYLLTYNSGPSTDPCRTPNSTGCTDSWPLCRRYAAFCQSKWPHRRTQSRTEPDKPTADRRRSMEQCVIVCELCFNFLFLFLLTAIYSYFFICKLRLSVFH